ncbi:uncharacterized protein I206_102541 [Kwoniella pini CBS 10737]|uniref:Uncharacterized protein n=1 Tax=Kwoniella pini CBS 10737 TaxID=1296096 RepID=A0AAJ8MM66_9TREE
MDIIHRLNPFHRPSSSLRSNITPTFDFNGNVRPPSSLESGSYQYSIDTTYPQSSLENERYVNSVNNSPIPPVVNTHRRTPSILRSLAHHPSLSALKSKSKKKRKDKEIIPPLPTFNINDDATSQEGKLRKNKSLPRDMRLSDDSRDDVPPIPSHPLLPSTFHNQLNKSRSSSVSIPRPGSTPCNNQISSRRKPAPSPRPEDILYAPQNQSMDHDQFQTPDSMRLKMNFEIDLPGHTISERRSESGLGLGSPRRRYMSFDQRLSPSQHKIRHLSSPADSPPKAPRTNQHPHPVPQSHLYAQTLYADSATFFSTDFGAPSAQPLDWSEEYQEADDGLDMFVNNVILPNGTPDERKQTSQTGASVDGSTNENDKVRVFSRDIYPPVSSSTETTPSKATPSPSKSTRHRRAESSPACSPIRKPARNKESEFARAAKRSSSPFEVKLSANVTKRMSLDAFGTSSLPKFDINEEVLAEENDVQIDKIMQDSPQTPNEAYQNLRDEDEAQLEDNGLDGYEAHELSKISESPDLDDHYISIQYTPVNHPVTDTNTHFFTPLSPLLNAQGLPSYKTTALSPSPLLIRKHMSEPPLPISFDVLLQQADRLDGLKDQLKAESFIIDILRSENEDLKSLTQKQKEEIERYTLDMQATGSELGVWKERSADQDIAINQLKQAMKENEEFFEGLQSAHDALAEQCAAVEEIRAASSQEHTEQIYQLRVANDQLRAEARKSEILLQDLKNGKTELASVVFELRRELKWAETEVQSRDAIVAEKDHKIKILSEDLQEKDSANVMLQNEVNDLKEQLEKLRATLAEKDTFLERYHEIAERASTDELTIKQQLTEKDIILTQLREEHQGYKQQIKDQRKYTGELEMNAQESEITITAVRERLESSEQFREALNLSLTDKNQKIKTLLSDLDDIQTQLTHARHEIVENAREISELKQKMEVSRFEKNERRFQAEVEIGQLHEQLEEMSRNSAEREWAGRQSTELIARLMEEKRGWEEEKDELIEMINHKSIDQESVSGLREQIENLKKQLSSMNHLTNTLKGEIDDKNGSLEFKNTLIQTQDAELSALRVSVEQFEDRWLDAKTSFDRQLKDSERSSTRLREEVEDLEIRLNSREEALKQLVLRNECEKQNDNDVTSRLLRFVNEIDALKLNETKLKNQLKNLQKLSTEEILRSEGLEKRLKYLEEDKELLNVALESKILELTLLQRNSNHDKRIPSTPLTSSTVKMKHNHTSSTLISSRNINSMSKSTSRIPNTPTPSTGDHTTLPRRLTTSTSATSSSRSRRDTISTPTPAIKTPLGESTIHNKAQMSESRNTSSTKPTYSTTGINIKKIERRTSLPVLVRRPSSVLSQTRESLSRVDEI